MSELNYQVDPDEPESTFEAIPAGEYIAVIENSDYVENKSGTGKMLKLTYQIIDGQFKGSKLFENLNLENASAQAEQISRKTLNSIGVACGVLQITDSALLHNIPMRLEVTVKTSDEYGKQNKIKKHMALDEKKVIQVKQENPAAPAANGKKHPWEK